MTRWTGATQPLTARHFAILAISLLAVLGFAILFLGGGQKEAEFTFGPHGSEAVRRYLRDLRGPALRDAYGFSTGPITVQTSEGPWTDDAITEVTPGGALARAGFRRGDTVWLWSGGNGAGVDALYSGLLNLDVERKVSFRVHNLYDLETGQDTRTLIVEQAKPMARPTMH